MAQNTVPPPATAQPTSFPPTVQIAPNSFMNVQTAPPRNSNNEIVVYTHTRNVNTPRIKRIYVDYDSKTSRLLGIGQIAVALLSIIFVAVGIPMEHKIPCYSHYSCFNGTNVFVIGFGYWCPVFFFISGAIAVAAAKQKTSSLIKALLGMSIVSLIFAILLWGSSIGALVDLSPKDKYSKVSMAMGGMLMLCGMAEIATSIWLSKICGDHLCCKGVPSITATAAAPHYVTTVNPDGTFSQVVQASAQHQVVVPGSVAAPPGSNIGPNVPGVPSTNYPQTNTSGQTNMPFDVSPPPYEPTTETDPRKTQLPE